MREYTYHVDLDGLLWQGDEAYDEPAIYEMFHRGMARTPDGKLFAICQGERCWVDAADTAFVVDSVGIATDAAGAVVGVMLVLKGGIQEPLDPASLSVGDENVLYAMVRDGEFPARFSRKAYYELARHIVPAAPGEDEEFILPIGGRRYPIPGS